MVARHGGSVICLRAFWQEFLKKIFSNNWAEKSAFLSLCVSADFVVPPENLLCFCPLMCYKGKKKRMWAKKNKKRHFLVRFARKLDWKDVYWQNTRPEASFWAHALIHFAFSCKKKDETLNEMLREETLSAQLSNTWMKRQDAQGSEFQIKASQQHKSLSGDGNAASMTQPSAVNVSVQVQGDEGGWGGGFAEQEVP